MNAIGFCRTPVPPPILSHSSIPRSFIFRSASGKEGGRLVQDQVCLRRSHRNSRGQAVQGVQGEEDVRLALEGARPVPQQLAAPQVWGDVFDANGLREARVKDEHHHHISHLSTFISFVHSRSYAIDPKDRGSQYFKFFFLCA